MIRDDVEHHLQSVAAHAVAEFAEVQTRARQVLVFDEKVDAPVAVEAGLATVGEETFPRNRVATAELFVRVVDDGCDPDRTEAHLADVVGVVEQAAEVATQIADIVRLARRRARRRQIEAAQRTALVAVVVARVAVDETIGQHEVDRVFSERLVGADNVGRRLN